MKRYYIVNPGYVLVPDGPRALLVSLDDIDPGVEYDDNCTNCIHPFNAQLLAFFNGTDTLEEILVKASEYFGLTVGELGNILVQYIENEKPFSIPYKDSRMYFPINIFGRED